MKDLLSMVVAVIVSGLFFCSCNEKQSSSNQSKDVSVHENKYGGYSTEAAYGKHLVEIAGCGDCHTPKKMTAQGPVPDMALLLSGHPASMPAPDVNRKEMESKGLAVTGDMTAWAGPWGISYSANLTPDTTGIGNWNEAQFIRAIREGKSKGLEGNRQLLPPMPWQDFRQMKDEELKAIFAYLTSIKPVHNAVPPPAPPVTKHG